MNFGKKRRRHRRPACELPFPTEGIPELVAANEALAPEEIVKCACSYGYESGLMVQCEHCLYWQHGTCTGFTESDHVPDGYLCSFCRTASTGKGKHGRTISQLNRWIKKGISPKFRSAPIAGQIEDHEAEAEGTKEEDEEALRDKAKRIGFLTSVALDIKENIASLGRRILDGSLPRGEIVAKQQFLREQITQIDAQLDGMDSDDDEDTFYGRPLSRSSSCSTLSADLPDFFGDSELGFNLTHSNMEVDLPSSNTCDARVQVELSEENPLSAPSFIPDQEYSSIALKIQTIHRLKDFDNLAEIVRL